MRFRILALAALVAVSIATADPRKQLLKNGSYEINAGEPNVPTLPADWLSFGGAGQSTDFPQHGLFSGLASVRMGAFVGMYQDTQDATEGMRVLMLARARHPSTAPLTGNIVAGIKLEFFPPQGTELPPPEENLAFDMDDPVDVWVPVSLVTTVPPNVDIARVVLISFDESTTNGSAYAESAFAERSSAPGVNQLMCEGFDCGSSGADGLNPPWDEFASPFSGARKNCFEVPQLDGTCVLKFIGQTCGVTQQISVTPGETLTISAFFRSRAAAPYADPLARAGVKVEWVAGNIPTPNIDIVPNENPISGTTNIINASSPTNQWLPVSIDFTMPDNSASHLRATVINGFGPGMSDAYFDSFEMVLTNVFTGSDADGDDDEDMLDIRQLQQVYTGSGGPRGFGGLVFDHNEDNDVDAEDLGQVLPNMTGPAVVP